MKRLIILLALLLSACGQGGTTSKPAADPNTIVSVEVIEARYDIPHLRITTGLKSYDIEYATAPAHVGDIVAEVADNDIVGAVNITVNGEVMDYYLQDAYWTGNGFTQDMFTYNLEV